MDAGEISAVCFGIPDRGPEPIPVPVVSLIFLLGPVRAQPAQSRVGGVILPLACLRTKTPPVLIARLCPRCVGIARAVLGGSN